MTETVFSLGSDPELNGFVPPVIRDSLGQMIAGYLDDVNLYLNSIGDPAVPDDDKFTNGADGAHAIFDSEQILQVMHWTARDEDARRMMYDAQRVYAALELHAAATSDPRPWASTAAAMAAEANSLARVFGALDHGQAGWIEQEAQTADATYNAPSSATAPLPSSSSGRPPD